MYVGNVISRTDVFSNNTFDRKFISFRVGRAFDFEFTDCLPCTIKFLHYGDVNMKTDSIIIQGISKHSHLCESATFCLLNTCNIYVRGMVFFGNWETSGHRTNLKTNWPRYN